MNRKDMILNANLTGANLAEKLIKIRPDIPIILCTGYSSLIDEEKARKLGIAAYMMKPLSMLQIAKTIRKLMERA
ncbi:MAG: response regulator [Desulfotignum sp.]|nr:response regulator [Desulfotignum sp.]